MGIGCRRQMRWSKLPTKPCTLQNSQPRTAFVCGRQTLLKPRKQRRIARKATVTSSHLSIVYMGCKANELSVDALACRNLLSRLKGGSESMGAAYCNTALAGSSQRSAVYLAIGRSV